MTYHKHKLYCRNGKIQTYYTHEIYCRNGKAHTWCSLVPEPEVSKSLISLCQMASEVLEEMYGEHK